jgi:nifR3 family TIM-barrel protein
VLRLGERITVDPPVVLAPLAGITNVAFRALCREFGAGLYISEMITSRALVERNPKTLNMITFAPDERPRSMQLYGVDPAVVGQAVRMIVEGDLADHVDLNFGCPVPKVTRRGGGSALPWKVNLFSELVSAAVTAADGQVPVTIKMRLGIDADHLTYREAGLRAQDAGVAYVALHGRTAADFYGGQANWEPIAELAELLDIPVLGNGDIWEASDATRMMAETGCAGVVIGRGCLGRPWLFADLAAALKSQPAAAQPATAQPATTQPAETPHSTALPDLKQVAATMHRHAELLVDWLGPERGVIDFRKHVAWYLKGFSVVKDLRLQLAMASSLGELDGLLGQLDVSQPFPADVLGRPRGRTSGARRVTLPYGWLDDRESRLVPSGAELPDSGG